MGLELIFHETKLPILDSLVHYYPEFRKQCLINISNGDYHDKSLIPYLHAHETLNAELHHYPKMMRQNLIDSYLDFDLWFDYERREEIDIGIEHIDAISARNVQDITEYMIEPTHDEELINLWEDLRWGSSVPYSSEYCNKMSHHDVSRLIEKLSYYFGDCSYGFIEKNFFSKLTIDIVYDEYFNDYTKNLLRMIFCALNAKKYQGDLLVMSSY